MTLGELNHEDFDTMVKSTFTRAVNVLCDLIQSRTHGPRGGMGTPLDCLRGITEKELMSIPHVGTWTIEAIKEILAKADIKLNDQTTSVELLDAMSEWT
jgi:hypothetical protein